tara:strand:- start:184 stop:654 length:471 start_codon:yes stop_codon:yes gene_type:complete
MKKKVVIILSFLLLLSCGFEPIYSKKELEKKFNFSISRIQFSGENTINQFLKNDLKNYVNIESKPIKYRLNINSKKVITITSKNKKGNAELFYMEIIINLDVYKGSVFEKSITLEDGFEYKNKSNKFQLEKYEKSIIENISSRLSRNIIEQLYSIQ